MIILEALNALAGDCLLLRYPGKDKKERLWLIDQLEPGSSLYNLPVALRVEGPLRADVLAPVGAYAPDDVYTTFTGMLTRTFSALRIHLNGQFTVGAEPTLALEADEAVTFGLRTVLVHQVQEELGLTLCGAGANVDRYLGLFARPV